MEKRSRRHIRDLVALAAFQGLSQNEIGCARISMMARSTNAPFKGRIQKRKTNHLQIFTFGLQRTAGPYKRANNGIRAYLIISSQRASIFLRWSFGQPGLPQSFFISREIVGPPRAQHGFEIGNTQHGIELQQPTHQLMCLLGPSGHCIARGIDP